MSPPTDAAPRSEHGTIPEGQNQPELARRLGAFDATMLVMGGIVGAGIFANPSVVARIVHAAASILGTWLVGGLFALAGAFVYAELADRLPQVGGQYAYIREAFSPRVAFLYGWVLLLVTQSGGMAAVAVTFARYLGALLGIALPEATVAVATLALLTAVNCLGVRWGGTVQSVLMVLKIIAIVALVSVGWLGSHDATPASAISARTDTPLAFMAALVPVLFAYGGWQTASFVSGELRDPRRDLPRGLLFGVIGVIALYLAVNAVCLAVLGAGGLAATTTPASDVMRLALGERGARLIAAGIAISTVGFLSQGMLTAPRVYYAMARDGLFFDAVGRLAPRSRVPVIAIALQGAWASVIALSGAYEQILSYVVSIDALLFGLTGAALLVLRRRAPDASRLRMPGHPWTTLLFVLGFWAVSLSAVIAAPRDAGIGVGILLLGVPVYEYWRRRRVH
jgi:basic amino acid/polyamine antiporter, APA family